MKQRTGKTPQPSLEGACAQLSAQNAVKAQTALPALEARNQYFLNQPKYTLTVPTIASTAPAKN